MRVHKTAAYTLQVLSDFGELRSRFTLPTGFKYSTDGALDRTDFSV